MIEITFCRTGSYCRPNKGHKGCFKKSFDSIESAVKYLFNARKNIFVPYLVDELGRDKHIVFSEKYKSMFR